MTAVDYHTPDPRSIVIGTVNDNDVTVQDIFGDAPFLNDPTLPGEEIVGYAKDLFQEYKRKHEITIAPEAAPTEIERIIMGRVTPQKVASLETMMGAAMGIGHRVRTHMHENKDMYIGMGLAAATMAAGAYAAIYMLSQTGK